mgnify:FL=1
MVKIDLQGKSKTLQRFAEKHSDKLDEVYWEEGHGFWFHLKGYHKPSGLRCDEATCSHTIRKDTVKEILEEFRWISKCNCQICK